MFTIGRNKKAKNLNFFKKGVNNARKHVYHISTVRKNLTSQSKRREKKWQTE